MSFDGIVTRALTDEFNSNYIGSRVDKIYQTEKDEIMINMRSKDRLLPNSCLLRG